MYCRTIFTKQVKINLKVSKVVYSRKIAKKTLRQNNNICYIRPTEYPNWFDYCDSRPIFFYFLTALLYQLGLKPFFVVNSVAWLKRQRIPPFPASAMLQKTKTRFELKIYLSDQWRNQDFRKGGADTFL